MPPVFQPQRIQIIGPSCAGKTTLGRTLGVRLGLPHTDIDDWLSPGWVECGHPVLRERLAPLAPLAASPGWVVSGNYFASTEPVLRPRVQWLIVLDFPLGLVPGRALRRTLTRATTGKPCCNGNREQLHRLFHREGVIRFNWRHWARRHAYYQTLADDPALARARVTLLDGPAKVAALLGTLPPAPEGDAPQDSNAPEAI